MGKKVTGIGLELESYGIDWNDVRDKGITLLEADVESMPFENESFDCIIASHILEHIQNMGNALSEIKRVLKEGGWFVIFIPKYTNIVCAGHVNIGWNIGQLMYVLLINGFDVKNGKFIEYGYSICGVVKRGKQEMPVLRGDRGDIHILTEARLFPVPIQNVNGVCDNFNGNIKALNWDNAEELLDKKKGVPSKRLQFMRKIRSVLEACIGRERSRAIGALLLNEEEIVNPMILK